MSTATDIIDLIGTDDAAKLFLHFGGRELKVYSALAKPKEIDIDHRQWVKFCSFYHRSRLYIPKGDRHTRNEKIIFERRKGATFAQLSTKFCLSNRQIINICSIK